MLQIVYLQPRLAVPLECHSGMSVDMLTKEAHVANLRNDNIIFGVLELWQRAPRLLACRFRRRGVIDRGGRDRRFSETFLASQLDGVDRSGVLGSRHCNC